MNDSFARYVRRIESPAAILQRAKATHGLDRIWPVIRIPLLITAIALLFLLQMTSPDIAASVLGIAPALLATIPALIGRWSPSAS